MDSFALQTTLRHFAAERDWQPFHMPKNLSMALMVWAAELAEIFQWNGAGWDPIAAQFLIRRPRRQQYRSECHRRTLHLSCATSP